MGGAVSSGRDNKELIDNLVEGKYIRSRNVERVFRALDRGDYMTPEARDQAYKDLAWRNGPLHMSAPCIYSEVMEGLELKRGLSFLNIGSGTGYLSTLVGLILGSNSVNHGVELHPVVVDYANKKLAQFLDGSPAMDEFDFCEPKFLLGNGLCLAPFQAAYDRVYCGAGCPEQYNNYFQQLLKVGGILIMPLNDHLLQVKRTGPREWVTRSLLNVSFATLRMPSKQEQGEVIRLDEQTPARLQVLARSVIRECMRGSLRRRDPQLREPPPRAPPAKRACPRRICIPVEDDSEPDNGGGLHDLDRASGANEMNALLNLVLSMGQNRVAGALRVDPLDSGSSSGLEPPPDAEPEEDDDDDWALNEGILPRPDEATGRISPTLRIVSVNDRPRAGQDPATHRPFVRSVLMFEFRDRNGVVRQNPPLTLERARRHRRRMIERRHRRQERRRRQDDGPPQRQVNEGEDQDNVNGDERFFDAEGHDGSERPPRGNTTRVQLNQAEKLGNVPEGHENEEEREDLNDNRDENATVGDEINKETDGKEINLENGEVQGEKLLNTENNAENVLIEDKNEKESTSKDEQSTSEETLRSGPPKRREHRYNTRASSSRDKVSKSRHHRSWTPKSSREFEEKEGEEKPEVPAEVEICLKDTDKAGTSKMEWDTSDTVEADAKTDEEEVVETVETKQEKRQKLDSGLGEENSPSGGSASQRSAETEAEPEHAAESRESDRSDCDEARGRRARQKRGHLSTRSSSSSEEEEIEEDEDGNFYSKPPRKPKIDHHAARRDALSLLMKQAVKELPLPAALQRYVNLGRSLDF